MLSSRTKGAVAELEIQTAAVRLGVPVLRPVVEQSRCDMAFDISGRIWRVQCKWGRLSTPCDTVIARIGGSFCSPNGYVTSTYSEDEVDLFGIYCGELDRAFLLPAALASGKHEVRLRIAPARNAQRACINLADDFNFDGAVAQLARASAWHAEGRGFESPQLHSTEDAPLNVGCDNFRDHFGYWLDRAAAGEHILITRRGKPRARLNPPDSPVAREPQRDERASGDHQLTPQI
jgi:antitoxin (DNA-binding transcriptional repressor) of toxin-antitoxin stability system